MSHIIQQLAAVDTSVGGLLPPGFRFGAATAAYQIEGGWDADGKGPSIWDTFLHAGHGSGDTGDVACDHYHRCEGDLDLIADLGLDAYRFSISWPRVLPLGAGAVNAAGLDFYDRLVDGLTARGIAAYPTLYHWDLPQALQDQGGWESRDTAGRFADYAAVVADRIGDRVAGWMTLNEPQASVYAGYISGQHAPGVRDPRAALRAAHHLLLAHGRAVQALRTASPGCPVGIALALSSHRPASDRPEDVAAAHLAASLSSRMFLDPVAGRGYPAGAVDYLTAYGLALPIVDGDLDTIAAPVDFIGVNYYTEIVVDSSHDILAGQTTMAGREGEPVTEMGWEIVPAGLTRLLSWLGEEYDFPAYYVTENGCALADAVSAAGGASVVRDPDRVAYIDAHLRAALPAIAGGVPLAGWFVWSLLDNLEWEKGFPMRFGLVRVDFDTLERIPKDSAGWYRDVIAAHRRIRQTGV